MTNQRTRLPLILTVLSIIACHPRERWVEAAYPGRFPTRTGQVQRTALGVRYSGDASPSLVDATFLSVEECLLSVELTAEERGFAQCYDDKLIVADDPVVLIGPWRRSCSDPSQQILTVEAPLKGCIDKGQSYPGCGCYWRSGYRYVHGDATYITTPSLHMLPDALVRHWTGCRNPWAVSSLANCASPLR